MTDCPRIAAMGQTLVEHGTDLTNECAVILCLMSARYDARDVEAGMDAAIAFAHRIYDARECLKFDATVRAVAAAMEADHAA